MIEWYGVIVNKEIIAVKQSRYKPSPTNLTPNKM